MDLRIREIRKKCGLTLKELAARIGCGESSLSQYETGKRQPDYETLLKISDYFGVSVDYLLGKDEEEQEETRDQEMEEYLEQLKNRSEMRMLFKLTKNATKEDVEQAVRIIEAIRKKD